MMVNIWQQHGQQPIDRIIGLVIDTMKIQAGLAFHPTSGQFLGVIYQNTLESDITQLKQQLENESENENENPQKEFHKSKYYLFINI